MKIELKWSKMEEIEEEWNVDDWCSADMLLRGVFHRLIVWMKSDSIDLLFLRA